MEVIRANADESDPVRSPDPIAFIYVFALVVDDLVPRNVVQRREDEIYEVMGELAGIVEEEDGSSWPDSRKSCVKLACIHFHGPALADTELRPKLTQLVHTWGPGWPF